MISMGSKHIFGTVKVGTKGQIVISKEARDMFGIKPGDTLMLIGDMESGLALITDAKLAAAFGDILKSEEKNGSGDKSGKAE